MSKAPTSQLDEQVGKGNLEIMKLFLKLKFELKLILSPGLSYPGYRRPLPLVFLFLFWGETASVHRLRLSLSKIDIVATDSVFLVSVLDSCPQNTWTKGWKGSTLGVHFREVASGCIRLLILIKNVNVNVYNFLT